MNDECALANGQIIRYGETGPFRQKDGDGGGARCLIAQDDDRGFVCRCQLSLNSAYGLHRICAGLEMLNEPRL